MKSIIMAVGKLRERYWRDGIAEYLMRLRPLMPLDIVEIKEEPATDENVLAQVKRAKQTEAEHILSALTADDWVVALDSGGKQLDSLQLAGELSSWLCSGRRRIVYIIGGSYGLDNSVLQRADIVLSFGRFTFPHQLMRLILVEQLYRAVKINRGEPYHK